MTLGYHVYNARTRQWLAEDEHSWTDSYFQSASFTSRQLAVDISERESKYADDPIYIMASS